MMAIRSREARFECSLKIHHNHPTYINLPRVAVFVLQIRKFLQHQDGSFQEDAAATLQARRTYPQFEFGGHRHRADVAPLLHQGGCSQPDLQPILDSFFSDAVSILNKDRSASRRLTNHAKEIPVITLIIKKFVRCEDDHQLEAEAEARALQLSMQQEPKPIPATKESIEALKKVKVEGDDDGYCMICMEQLSREDDDVTSMPCSHHFHGGCIEQWLNTSHTCPLCRFPMPTATDIC